MSRAPRRKATVPPESDPTPGLGDLRSQARQADPNYEWRQRQQQLQQEARAANAAPSAFAMGNMVGTLPPTGDTISAPAPAIGGAIGGSYGDYAATNRQLPRGSLYEDPLFRQSLQPPPSDAQLPRLQQMGSAQSGEQHTQDVNRVYANPARRYSSGPWSQEDDKTLLDLRGKRPITKFPDIVVALGGRFDEAECRRRHVKLTTPSRAKDAPKPKPKPKPEPTAKPTRKRKATTPEPPVPERKGPRPLLPKPT